MDGFSNLVHQILINEEKYDVKKISHDMDIYTI